MNIAIANALLEQWEADQKIWDATVLAAYEGITGEDGGEDPEALDDWLLTPAAKPALAALASARAGTWISPRDCNLHVAMAYWRAQAGLPPIPEPEVPPMIFPPHAA